MTNKIELINTIRDASNKGEIDCQFAKWDGDDFLIVESWDDVAKIQKLLDPTFEPKDEYDTRVIDDFMDWGFSDSYTTCDDCGEVISTEPDGYSWTPYFFVSDGGYILCGDCVRKDSDEYLRWLVNNPDVANTILSDEELEDAGFEKLDNEYENGFYGRTDSPKEILNKLLDKYPYGEFIFSISGREQFRTNFVVFGSGMEEMNEGIVKGKSLTGKSKTTYINKKKAPRKSVKENFEDNQLEDLFKEFVDTTYGRSFEQVGNGVYEYEIAPYNDNFSLSELKNFMRDVESIDDFINKIDAAYDVSDYYFDINEEFEDFLTMKGIDVASDEFQDFVQEHLEIHPDYNYWLDTKYNCHIFVDSGDSNYDFGLNPDYSTNYTFDLEDKDVVNNASLIWVAKQQGYSPEEVKKALDGEPTQSKFLKSLEREVANTTSGNNLFVILCKATLGEILNWNTNPTNITINKATNIGLFDAISGGGSVLNVQLEKPLTIPANKVGEFWFDSGLKNYNGYDVDFVYGLSDHAYDANISFGTNESMNKKKKNRRIKESESSLEDMATDLESTPYISRAFVDDDGSIRADTKWHTSPRKAHADYVDTMKYLGNNYNICVMSAQSRDGNSEFAYFMRITPKKN